MALNFPSSPLTNDLYSFGGRTWQYDGVAWNLVVSIDKLGYTGSSGYTGSQGNTGFTGSQGIQGFTGSQGNTGFTGSQGSQGATGFTGSASTVAGPIGFTGSQGATGFTGSAGSGGGSSVTVSDTAPSTPSAGDLWWDSTIGQLRVYYNDGTSVQWVDAVNTQGIAGTNGVDGLGVPAGGTVDQVLKKNSSTNNDTSWSSLKTINSQSLLGTGDIAISASPAGADTQIQYNSSGTFGASANLTYDSATNRFQLIGTDPELVLGGITTEPASAPTGQLFVYAKNIGGRMMLKQKGPSGLDTPFQSGIAQNKVGWWNPPGNTANQPTTVGFQPFSTISTGSTATARNVATTNLLTRTRRIGYNSAASTNAYAGIVHPAAQWTLGDGSGLGGFYYIVRWGYGNTGTGSAHFIGLSSSVAAQTDGTGTDPGTLTNSIGVGAATGDTNLQIVYGGSAAQTKINLGSNFPKSTSTNLYELIFYAPPSLNNTVYYRVTNLSSNIETSGTLTGTAGTALPSSSTFLAPRIWRHTGSSTTAVQLDIVSIYIETDS